MPGELPAHDPVAECDNTIRNARIDERLRTDDAAGSARAVDNHRRLGVRGHLADPIDEFNSRAAHASGDAEVAELRYRSGVEHH